ncbi:hypothetical protein RIF29_22205 [Crotalaria pallida]|uniref:Uncharacterized protein n=1 Tax=Crotalaria pallida TaxID=3830 RepID=A0AAN9F3Y2_CROPI
MYDLEAGCLSESSICDNDDVISLVNKNSRLHLFGYTSVAAVSSSLMFLYSSNISLLIHCMSVVVVARD